MDFYQFGSPIGFLSLAAEEGKLTRLWLPNAPVPRLMPRETPLLLRARDQLLEYLAGDRKEFDLPLAEEGTPFQLAVRHALEQIPYGTVRSYGRVAADLGKPRAAMAVGQALACNPLPILIPCHRVVGADGSLTGWMGGLELKRTLLTLEGVRL